jgi:TIR domain
MKTVSHIFISYDRDDTDFAELLSDRLKEQGCEVWTDRAGLHGGDDYHKEIDEAIRRSAALVVVMTPAAKASEYVTYEWAFAWGAGIKIIPVLRKETKLHSRLESLNYIDFRHARPFAELITVIKEAEISEPERPVRPLHAEMQMVGDIQEALTHRRLRDALEDINWTWRSIEKLATKAGIPEEEAHSILSRDPDVEFGLGKSGRRIAKLKWK